MNKDKEANKDVKDIKDEQKTQGELAKQYLSFIFYLSL